jgi:hypothetical protein
MPITESVSADNPNELSFSEGELLDIFNKTDIVAVLNLLIAEWEVSFQHAWSFANLLDPQLIVQSSMFQLVLSNTFFVKKLLDCLQFTGDAGSAETYIYRAKILYDCE